MRKYLFCALSMLFVLAVGGNALADSVKVKGCPIDSTSEKGKCVCGDPIHHLEEEEDESDVMKKREVVSINPKYESKIQKCIDKKFNSLPSNRIIYISEYAGRKDGLLYSTVELDISFTVDSKGKIHEISEGKIHDGSRKIKFDVDDGVVRTDIPKRPKNVDGDVKRVVNDCIHEAMKNTSFCPGKIVTKDSEDLERLEYTYQFKKEIHEINKKLCSSASKQSKGKDRPVPFDYEVCIQYEVCYDSTGDPYYIQPFGKSCPRYGF